MDSEARRNTILQKIKIAQNPISASYLASELGVSRQIVVGDIALLRARGIDITATARGYRIDTAIPSGQYIGKIVCQHSLRETAQELSTIVSLGGKIIDVIVEHYIYGDIKGQLDITTHEDIDIFINRVQHGKSHLLSNLTDGLHIHTIGCKNKDVFDTILSELARLGLLYNPSK